MCYYFSEARENSNIKDEIMNQLLISFLISLSFNAFSRIIKCDLGDEWIEDLSSGKEVIECNTFDLGNGACYDGNPYKIAHEYFKRGDTFDLEEGEIEVTTVYVKNREIRVSYIDEEQEKTRLYIKSCE